MKSLAKPSFSDFSCLKAQASKSWTSFCRRFDELPCNWKFHPFFCRKKWKSFLIFCFLVFLARNEMSLNWLVKTIFELLTQLSPIKFAVFEVVINEQKVYLRHLIFQLKWNNLDPFDLSSDWFKNRFYFSFLVSHCRFRW